MDDLRQKTLDALTRAISRDSDKGGTGCRSTAEVAEWVGISTAKARGLLDRLADEGIIDCFDSSPDGARRPVYDWRLAGHDWDDDRGVFRIDGEVIPSFG